jgi:7-keto-8-aminopelargonate synthetase-like enzyme
MSWSASPSGRRTSCERTSPTSTRRWIWTNAIDSPAIGVQGVRITPHVFIQPTELDVLVKAISEIARA